ncbi:MAG: HD domain-containing protein [Treponemataceae bacterium]
MRVKGPNPIEALPTPSNPFLGAYLQAMHLKRLFRQGWLKRGVSEANCESVADHSFGVALLALTAPSAAEAAGFPFDRGRAVLLAVVHELGEVYAGDITPVDGVSKEEKSRRERESMERVIADLENGTATMLRSLWEEFEAETSREARFVRELDRLEMGIQAAVYKAEGHPRMDEFLESADKAVKSDALRSMLRSAEAAAAGKL